MSFFKKKKKERKYHENGFIDIEMEELVVWNEANGEGCMATDKITKEGFKVGYMYREEPSMNYSDSGWRFFKGDEDEDYSNNVDNVNIFRLNTIANYDPDIIKYLNAPIGTHLIRVSEDKFIVDDQTSEILILEQEIK